MSSAYPTLRNSVRGRFTRTFIPQWLSVRYMAYHLPSLELLNSEGYVSDLGSSKDCFVTD